uniref:RIIa domain-containing protein n=1 Tax=Biomphalaria glabrata TaxID=6526 RepID=A0A2C9K3R5_BIOGL
MGRELPGMDRPVNGRDSNPGKRKKWKEKESESCYDQYLKRSLGNYLSQCLQEVVELKPRDPIEFIAKYLYKCVDNEHYHKEKILFLQSLVQQKQLQEMEGKRRQLVIKQMMAGAEEQKRTIRQLKLAELNDLMITLSLESDPPDKSLLFRAKALAVRKRYCNINY